MKKKDNNIVCFFETSADWHFPQKILRKDAFQSNRQASLSGTVTFAKVTQNPLSDTAYRQMWSVSKIMNYEL